MNRLSALVLGVITAASLAGCGTFGMRYRMPDSFDGLTREEIQSRLPPASLLLVDTTSAIPPAWPTNLRVVAQVTTCDGSHPLVQEWRMCPDGVEWIHFYAFDLDAHRTKFKLEPAMVYERTTDSGVIPVMSLFFQEDGLATRSSRKWCDDVRDDIIEKSGRLRTTH